MNAVVTLAVAVLGLVGIFAEVTLAAPVDTSNNSSEIENENANLQQVAEVLIDKFYLASDNAVDTDDQIVDEFENWEAPEDIRKNYPYYLSGFDDENRPIWVAEFGRYNFRKLVEEGGENLQAFNKYAEQAIYRILKSISLRSTPEEPVTEVNFIVDFDDFKLSTVSHVPTISYIIHMVKLYRDLFEKHIHAAVGINANFVAERLIGLVRPVFGSIMEKIEIHGNDRSKWIASLRRHFPVDQLPEWYGGKKGFTPLRVYG